MKKDCPPLSSSTSLPAESLLLGGDSPPNIGGKIFHSLQDPSLVVTLEGKILTINTALLEATQKEEKDVVGKGICEIIHGGRWPHIKCPLEEFLLTWTSRVEDSILPGLNGDYSMTIAPVKETGSDRKLILIIARKLTPGEVKRVDSIRTAQLAAIGELAAGVAHEVNNPINGIINFAQLLLDDSAEDTEQAMILKKIVQEGERIAAITYNLLSFARENENELTLVDLNEVIYDSISLVQHQLKNDGIAITTDLFQPSCLIRGNHLQFMQVVLNLVSNSKFALNERYKDGNAQKLIDVSCQPVAIDGIKYFRLVIRDEGTGIPQGILGKLFEPFFTSKQAGQGSGLGLSISYGIVKNHNGTLRVDSKLHKYTEMIIELPAAEM